jgi:hypothetical protein
LRERAFRSDSHNRAINNAYLNEVVEQIPGWLNKFAAACLMDLLDLQNELGWDGSLLEIGVYGGRFCSVLARDAARRASHLVGIDPFERFPVNEVHDRLLMAVKDAPGSGAAPPRISLFEDISGNWTPDRLLSVLGERSRFVHIDGSHKRDDVLWDLALADTVMTSNALVAVDDWLNAQCVGVMEATFQFFQSQPRASVPFAFVGGKLLLCGCRYAATYKSRLKGFAATDKTYEQSKRYQHRLKIGIPWIEQPLFGEEIVVLT